MPYSAVNCRPVTNELHNDDVSESLAVLVCLCEKHDLMSHVITAEVLLCNKQLTCMQFFVDFLIM